MRAYLVCGILLCSLLLCLGQSHAAPSLTYYGHSFVKIKTSEGKVIYIDPYAVNEFADSADIILVTHEHSDHNEISRVIRRTGCRVIRAANALISGVYQTIVIGNVTITGVMASNSYHPVNACVGFVVSFDGVKLYHAGDTGLLAEMANLATENITYALLPMDGIYTMTPEAATQAAARIQAAHDIPIHTMPPPDTYSDAIVARFTSPNVMVVRPISTIELTVTTSVSGAPLTPGTFSLDQNYPNPFNPTTVIRFQTPRSSFVSLKVFDILGKEMISLVEEELAAGDHHVTFDGGSLASGVYFYKLTAGSFSATKRMLILR